MERDGECYHGTIGYCQVHELRGTPGLPQSLEAPGLGTPVYQELRAPRNRETDRAGISARPVLVTYAFVT